MENAAVKQLSSVKKTRVTATNALASETQAGFNYLQHGLASTSKNVQSISVHISKEV
jgi:kinesin family protein 11